MEAFDAIWNWVQVTEIPPTEAAIEQANIKVTNLRAYGAFAGGICLAMTIPLAAFAANILGLVIILVTFALTLAATILPYIAQNHPNFSQCFNTRLGRVSVQCIMFIISFLSSLLFKFPEIYHYASFGLALIAVNLFIIAIPNAISFGARSYILGFIVGLTSALPHHKWAAGAVGLTFVLVVFVFGEWIDAKQAEIDRAVQTRQNQQNVAQGGQGAGEENAPQGGQGAGQENAAQGGQGAGQENVAQGAGQESVAQGAQVAG